MTRFPYTRLGLSRIFLLLAIIVTPEEETEVYFPMWPINDLIKIKQKKLRDSA